MRKPRRIAGLDSGVTIVRKVNSFQHEDVSENEVKVVGANGQIIAHIERREDAQWHIVPASNWAMSSGYDVSPSATKADALKKLEAS